MVKLISPKVHGIIDYLSVPLLLAAGPLFRFGGLPAEITSTVAGIALVISAFTAYPLGLVKMIPFKIHLMIDIVVGLAFIAAPFILRFDDFSARWFFVGFGLVALSVAGVSSSGAQSAGNWLN